MTADLLHEWRQVNFIAVKTVQCASDDTEHNNLKQTLVDVYLLTLLFHYSLVYKWRHKGGMFSIAI